LPKNLFKPSKRANASEMHRKVWHLVQELYGGMTLLEEQLVPVEIDGRRTNLFADIVIKDLQVVIECNGRQHEQYVPHFHSGDPAKLREQKQRDQVKRETIEAAGYAHVVIRHDQWQKLTAKRLDAIICKAIDKANK
jgi:very-short-patch-repair endonuclease